MAKEKTAVVGTPTQKKQITKMFMFNYIKVEGTKEDKKWFKELVKENTITRANTLPSSDKESYNTLNYPAMRNAFVARFFPELDNSIKNFDDFMNAIDAL